MNWDDSYPNKAQLRLEVAMMQQAILEALLHVLGEGAFVGIYVKGSSVKPWDSLIDYVPELSDVDVQMVLHQPDLLSDLRRALEVQAEMEQRFLARVPLPLHLPRPQLQVINHLLQSKTFSPSPVKIVRTLFGEPYEVVHPPHSSEALREADLFGLLERTTPEQIAAFGLDFIDKPGKYLFTSLRQLSWRVGPTASRVLSVLGAEFEAAWGQNRTHLHRLLLEHGQAALAQPYAAFYLNAWEFWRSGYQSTNAAREAVLAGVGVLELGLEAGKRASAHSLLRVKNSAD